MSVSGERVPVITETRDHEVVGNTAQSGAVGSSIRQRRKIERNTSAPLPGMLQVMSSFIRHLRLMMGLMVCLSVCLSRLLDGFSFLLLAMWYSISEFSCLVVTAETVRTGSLSLIQPILCRNHVSMKLRRMFVQAPSRKYLAPTLSDGATRQDKMSTVMGVKKRRTHTSN